MKSNHAGIVTLLLIVMFSLVSCYPLEYKKSKRIIKNSKVFPSDQLSTHENNPFINDRVIRLIYGRGDESDGASLNIPFFKQETNYYCGPASTQMVLEFHGVSLTQTQLALELKTHPVTGTEYLDLTRVLNFYLFQSDEIVLNDAGYHVQTFNIGQINAEQKTEFLDRIKQDVNTAYPVIVAINASKLYENKPNANHFIVIKGYFLKNQDTMITYLDPYYDINGQYEHVISFEQLVEAMINNEEPAYIW